MEYDIIVLGGGPGGYLAAERAGQAQKKVLCIEEAHLGGTCLNEGCIPTKTLLYSGKLYAHAKHSQAYGVHAKDVTLDHSAVIDRKEQVIRMLVGGVGATLKACHVDVVDAKGVITGRTADGCTVEAGGQTYTAKNLIIATGSSCAVPPIPGLKEGLASGFVLTNREMLALRELPQHLVVLGGGVIGLEMATYYAMADVDTTVVEMQDHIGGPSDRDMVKILQKNCDFHIGGIITNEQGGEATVNGWLQAAVTGLPVVDAPCNGRAHPTGVMGSMNLHKIPDYTTVQACVGGNPDTGNHIECFFEGNIDHTSKMVRLASIEAGGLVAVARNPVKVSYARENCAIGGVSFAIETGKAFLKGLETSVEEGVNSLCTFLNGRILARGPVQNFSIETTGGFDVGYATVDGCDMTFWNEYATVEKDGKRLATFPDLIMTINAKTGEPVTTAMMEEGLDVYVITTDKKNLKLSPTMYAPELLKATEDVIKKDLISYLDK